MTGTRWLSLFLGLLVLLAALIWWEYGPVHQHKLSEEPDLCWFEDVTDSAGLDFVHDAGPVGDYFFPQIMGSGAALFDFDGDGLLDIYLLTNGGPQSTSTNRLYRNLGGAKFQDVTAGSGLGFAGCKMTRRILGLAHVEDLESIANPDRRAECEKRALKLARAFMVEGQGFTDIRLVSDAARALQRETVK